MGYSYDYYNRLESPELFLCNPDGTTIGCINGYERSVTLRFNDLSDLSFKVADNITGDDGSNIRNLIYDFVQVKRLVHVPEVGVFTIVKIDESDSGNSKEKSVTCESLQGVFKNKGVVMEDRAYALYNEDDPSDTLYNPDDAGSIPSVVGQLIDQIGVGVDMHNAPYTPSEPYDKWTITYVPPEMIYSESNKVLRHFTSETKTSYEFMATDVEKAFEVIADFDTLNKTISFISSADLQQPGELCLSFFNFMKNVKVVENSESIVTVMEVNGNNIDIRAVNPIGTNYLLDFGYFMEGHIVTDVASNGVVLVDDEKWKAFEEEHNLTTDDFGDYYFVYSSADHDWLNAGIGGSGVITLADIGCVVEELDPTTTPSVKVTYGSKWMSRALVEKLLAWESDVAGKISDFSALTQQLREAYTRREEAKGDLSELSVSLGDLRTARDKRTEKLSRESTKLHGIITEEHVKVGDCSVWEDSAYYTVPFAQQPPGPVTCYNTVPTYNTSTGKFKFNTTGKAVNDFGDIFNSDLPEADYLYFGDSGNNTNGFESYCKLDGGVKLDIQLSVSATGAITPEVEAVTWKDKCMKNAGQYVFTFTGSAWTLMWSGTSTTVSLSEYGISYKGVPITNDTITVDYAYDTSNVQYYCSGFTRYGDYDDVEEWIGIKEWLVTKENAALAAAEYDVEQYSARQREISDQLNIFAYLSDTQGLVDELGHFWIEGEYTDEYIASLDSTSPEEEISLALELYENGQKALDKASKPSYSFSIEAAGSIFDYEFANELREIELGHMIRVERAENVWYYPALLEMSYDLDNPDSLSLTFSDRLSLRDWPYTFADMIAKSASVSKQVVASWSDLTAYSKDETEIQTLIARPLDATLRAGLANAVNQEIVIDDTGLLGRKFKTLPNGTHFVGEVDYQADLYNPSIVPTFHVGDVYTVRYTGSSGTTPDGTQRVSLADSSESPPTWTTFDSVLPTYESEQIRIMNNLLLFTDDNWETAKLALGKITLEDGVTQAYGLIAEYLIGRVTLTDELYVSNGSTGSGNYIKLDKNGIFIARNGISMLEINASTGDAYFYGNGEFRGSLRAATGDFSGMLTSGGGNISGELTVDKVSGSKIEAKTLSGNSVSIGGVTLAKSYGSGTPTTVTATLEITKSADRTGQPTLVTVTAMYNGEEVAVSSDLTIDVTYQGSGVTPETNRVTMLAGTSSVSTVFPGQMSGSTITTNPSTVTVYAPSGSTERQVTIPSHFSPKTNNSYDLGRSDNAWRNVYSYTTYTSDGTVHTSDRAKKRDIKYGLGEYDKVFDGLRPCEYKLKDDEDGRVRFGLIAQDVGDAFDEDGKDRNRFALYDEEDREDGSTFYGLQYSELHGLEIEQIQQLKARVRRQEEEIDKLKAMVLFLLERP